MNLREALETAMRIIPYRYNVPSRDVEESKMVVYNAAKDGTLKELIDRDTGAEPILENKVTTHHEVRADGSGGFKRNEFCDWFCPKCGYFVGELFSGFGRWHIQSETSFCAKCGQRIDWSKPKEEEKRRYEERKRREREEWEKEHQVRLDNMHEYRRKKYGLMEKRDEDSNTTTT